MGDKFSALSNSLIALAGISFGASLLLFGAAMATAVLSYALNKGWF